MGRWLRCAAIKAFNNSIKKRIISVYFIDFFDWMAMATSAHLRVSLEQWRALVAVVDHGSYAKAAEALHKTQSSVTYAVQKLQSSLGVEAFTLEGRKSRLTPTGQLLYRRARVLLDEAVGIEHTAGSVSAGWEPEIRIAAEVVFPNTILLRALDRFGAESPHTRIEIIESVMAGTTEALVERRADLGIAGRVPQDLSGESLLRARFVPAAHPEHPLHKLGRPVTARDLHAHRQLLVRESDAKRATRTSFDTAQRWTFSNMGTSMLAAVMGFGFAWYSEEKIRDELEAGLLKPLPLRDGGERFVDLYLVFADRENAGPGTLRLAAILREEVRRECGNAIHALRPDIAARTRWMQPLTPATRKRKRNAAAKRS
jgi:DNA-binding transcriptional LysR family regulator